MKRSAIILLTGFLGCGKTTLLAQMLRRCTNDRRIAVIQNEFSQSSIDGDLLRDVTGDFEMRELNTGSIFCVCLFSKFKQAVVEIATSYAPDIIVVEASGIADPIAIAELMEDVAVSDVAYLARIFTVVDAPRFEHVLSRIVGVRHQVQVADAVLVNKCDLVDDKALERVSQVVKQINPHAKELRGEFGNFDLEELLSDELSQIERERMGELTRCGEGGYISKSFRYAGAIRRDKLESFLESLTAQTLRLKGYVTTTDSERLMVQYVPGQITITPCERELMGCCELISIGYVVPNFGTLKG